MVDRAADSLAAKEKVNKKIPTVPKQEKSYINKYTWNREYQNNHVIHCRLKSHHVDEDNEESDDDEFTGKGVVYDSDEEEDGPSDDNLTTDKKNVLKFFNEVCGECWMSDDDIVCDDREEDRS